MPVMVKFYYTVFQCVTFIEALVSLKCLLKVELLCLKCTFQFLHNGGRMRAVVPAC